MSIKDLTFAETLIKNVFNVVWLTQFMASELNYSYSKVYISQPWGVRNILVPTKPKYKKHHMCYEKYQMVLHFIR